MHVLLLIANVGHVQSHWLSNLQCSRVGAGSNSNIFLYAAIQQLGMSISFLSCEVVKKITLHYSMSTGATEKPPCLKLIPKPTGTPLIVDSHFLPMTIAKGRATKVHIRCIVLRTRSGMEESYNAINQTYMYDTVYKLVFEIDLERKNSKAKVGIEPTNQLLQCTLIVHIYSTCTQYYSV